VECQKSDLCCFCVWLGLLRLEGLDPSSINSLNLWVILSCVKCYKFGSVMFCFGLVFVCLCLWLRR